MKNIITILLILILPVSIYLFMSKNSENYSAVAKAKDSPTLISFTSTMCTDCKRLKAVLSEVQPNYSDKVNFIAYNALDKNRTIQNAIKKYKVTLVPTIIFLDKDGKEINKIEGFIPKEELINELEEAINE